MIILKSLALIVAVALVAAGVGYAIFLIVRVFNKVREGDNPYDRDIDR